MKRTILAVVAATLGLSASAFAAEKPGQWYVAPMVSVNWADSDRFVDDDIGGAVSFGRAINDDYNIELHAFGYSMDGDNPTDLWGGGVDGLQVFFRDSRISPFLLLGLGWDKKNRGFGPDSDAPYFNAGVGFLIMVASAGWIAVTVRANRTPSSGVNDVIDRLQRRWRRDG